MGSRLPLSNRGRHAAWPAAASGSLPCLSLSPPPSPTSSPAPVCPHFCSSGLPQPLHPFLLFSPSLLSVLILGALCLCYDPCPNTRTHTACLALCLFGSLPVLLSEARLSWFWFLSCGGSTGDPCFRAGKVACRIWPVWVTEPPVV